MLGPIQEELGLTQAPSCAERVVHLDVALGEGGSGSKEDPFGDFFEAYYEAQDLRFADLEAGPVVLVMTEGTTALSQAVSLKGGVMILGGFTRDEGAWTYLRPRARTVLDVARADGLSYSMGLFALDVDKPTVLSHLDVQVADALGDFDGFAGASSYGLRAIDSSGLTIAHSRIRAGQGGNGGRGLDGVDGGFGRGGTSQGVVDGEFWNPLDGQGEMGEWGTNGGGGGGSTEYIYSNDTEWSWGARGGGGGSGGCVGSPGEGGAGGVSYGAYCIESPGAAFVDSRASTGGGADGGRGPGAWGERGLSRPSLGCPIED